MAGQRIELSDEEGGSCSYDATFCIDDAEFSNETLSRLKSSGSILISLGSEIVRDVSGNGDREVFGVSFVLILLLSVSFVGFWGVGGFEPFSNSGGLSPSSLPESSSLAPLLRRARFELPIRSSFASRCRPSAYLFMTSSIRV